MIVTVVKDVSRANDFDDEVNYYLTHGYKLIDRKLVQLKKAAPLTLYAELEGDYNLDLNMREEARQARECLGLRMDCLFLALVCGKPIDVEYVDGSDRKMIRDAMKVLRFLLDTFISRQTDFDTMGKLLWSDEFIGLRRVYNFITSSNTEVFFHPVEFAKNIIEACPIPIEDIKKSLKFM